MRPDEHSKGYLYSLDGWRAMAVIMVMLSHCPPLPSFLGHLQGAGGSGVQIFFAISGLLICTRLLAEESRFGRISLSGFYLRRVFRILPASLVYLLVVALPIVPFDRPSWLSALFFYRNYYSALHGVSAAGWFTSHFWSLSVEEHFYFLLPSILLFFPKTRAWILGALVTVCLALSYSYLAHAHYGNTIYGFQRSEFCLPSLLIPAIYAIALKTPEAKAKAVRYLPTWLGCIFGALCFTHLHIFPTEPANDLFYQLLRPAFFPLLLLGTIFHPRNILTRLLEFSPLRFIGHISYSLYLWQALFLTHGDSYTGYRISALQHPYIGIVCTVICAVLSYYFVETPMIALGRRVIPQRHKPDSTNGPDSLDTPVVPTTITA
jgi:peptidoglycan/LPS O-acetylase OafA/YrhL